jgi:hypothetical protein
MRAVQPVWCDAPRQKFAERDGAQVRSSFGPVRTQSRFQSPPVRATTFGPSLLAGPSYRSEFAAGRSISFCDCSGYPSNLNRMIFELILRRFFLRHQNRRSTHLITHAGDDHRWRHSVAACHVNLEPTTEVAVAHGPLTRSHRTPTTGDGPALTTPTHGMTAEPPEKWAEKHPSTAKLRVLGSF